MTDNNAKRSDFMKRLISNTYKYYIEAEEIPEVNAVVCVIDAATQVSRPPSAASSLRPLLGVRIEAIITGAEPVFQASSSHAARSSPPPPIYPDSAPRVRRRPPHSFCASSSAPCEIPQFRV